MKCPYCNQDMQAGSFRSPEMPVRWFPDGGKHSLLIKHAIPLGIGSFWKGYRAKAYYCPDCQIILTPVAPE